MRLLFMLRTNLAECVDVGGRADLEASEACEKRQCNRAPARRGERLEWVDVGNPVNQRWRNQDEGY